MGQLGRKHKQELLLIVSIIVRSVGLVRPYEKLSWRRQQSHWGWHRGGGRAWGVGGAHVTGVKMVEEVVMIKCSCSI